MAQKGSDVGDDFIDELPVGPDQAAKGDALRGAKPAPGEQFVVLDPDAEGGDVRRGGIVRHRRFGEGAVLEIVEGAELKVVAEFPGWGTMTILRRYLEVVRS